jgi:hypothetical protein
LKRYAVTGSRCSHCWSVLDKGFAQTQGGWLLHLFISPLCYLSSPTFLTPFHWFYPEVLLWSRPMFTTPMAILYTKAKSGRYETNGDTYVASWFFPFSLSSYSMRL